MFFQLEGIPHTEKNLKRNEDLNLNLEQNTSFTAAASRKTTKQVNILINMTCSYDNLYG